MNLPDSLKLQTLNALVSEFDLGTPISIVQLPSDPLTAVFKLQTASGTWLLKRHQAARTAQQLAAEQALTNSLMESGFSQLPRWLKTTSSQPFFVLSGQFWSAHEFVACDSAFQWTKRSWQPEHSRQAGLLLGKLHHAGHLLLQQDRDLHNPLGGSIIAQLPEWWNNALTATAASESGAKILAQLGQDPLAQLQKQLNDLIARLSLESQALQTIVHGDFHPGNVLYAGSLAKAVIDFDFAHVEHPLYDVAYAVVMFAGMGTREPQALSDEHVHALLSGYQDSPQTSLAKTALSITNELLSQYIQIACYLNMLWALSGYCQPAADHQLCSQVFLQAAYLLQNRQT